MALIAPVCPAAPTRGGCRHRSCANRARVPPSVERAGRCLGWVAAGDGARKRGASVATSNIEIAQRAELWPITRIAEGLGIPEEALEPYGRHKAKVALSHLAALRDRPRGRLVLMTAISPTPAGEGKTTTTVGLGDALNRIGERAMICLREPALGPVFGMKGGAAGGGYAQVVPMEDINLHFTGDFAAIAVATNLLAALIDNHIHHGNALDIDVRRVTWRRVLDVNDRALRDTVIGLGGPGNGYPRESGFDIVVASEVMAIFCLASSLEDLKNRLGEIVVAYTRDRAPVRARDLHAHGAMAAILRDALAPNLVQTLEHTPAFVHGGPFANIAHGCNSFIATDSALRLADYVVTEAGFGADLGAEKFVDILCRSTGLRPDAAVIVATVRAVKYHGGVEVADLASEDVAAVTRGIVNLERHLTTVRETWGIPAVVAINHRAEDTDAEIAALVGAVEAAGARAVVAKHFADGGAGAEDLAREVVRLCAEPVERGLRFTYPDEAGLWQKMSAIATRVYGASGITASTAVRAQIRRLQEDGYGGYPVCVAKTQYSFSTDAKLRGAPTGHSVDIREVRLAAGARFIVMVCGDIMTMPGLPAIPAANTIDVTEDGRIVGLF
ncbi:formate--tetrahydrofolate ligase [Microbacterium sp. CFH 90308]|uniref:Formate--tetrahydrofolate ligase n=1 Tax=Microbacterium salsuginis TaxID=2722803 RepID=A0ABX1KFB6_9MICO|nr:formate--tetrahydrofolate ligase [Microbacterium sp. CFH 90308]